MDDEEDHDWRVQQRWFSSAYQYEASTYFANLQPGMTFTADVMHQTISPNIPYEPVSPNAWGGAFQGFIAPLLETQQAEIVGYRPSVRASNHKHAYKEYRKL